MRAPLLFALLLPLCFPHLSIGEPISQPNVLWIIAEDMGPELGCYGTPEVRTPVLDALATRGTRYTRAFTVTPVWFDKPLVVHDRHGRPCPSTPISIARIATRNIRCPRECRVLTDWLRPIGYTTANVKQLTDDPELAKVHYGHGKDRLEFQAIPRGDAPSTWRSGIN